MTTPSRFDRHVPARSSALISLATLVALVLALPATSRACSVPVFRYALEHWQADPYVAVVFHRGELTDEQRTLVDQLDPQGDTGNSIANILVRTVDLDDETSEAVLELYYRHESDTLPLLSLQSPSRLGPPQTLWQGELTAANVAGLVNSPLRRQLRERLLAGESVVWVFLESGKQESDDAAFALLEQEVSRLQGVIELPAIEEQDLAELTVSPEELKIAFSTLRLARDDEQERPLIEMLLRVEPDLLDEPFVNQAMAFPIFGRGRALYALVGEGITAETIEDASRFLTGACQCTVKAQNPGVDLLMAVDWDQYVTPALPYDESQPLLTGLTTLAAAMQADAEGAAAPADAEVGPPTDEPAQPPAESADQASDDTTTPDVGTPVADDAPLLNPDSMPTTLVPSTPTTEAAGVQSLTRSITLTLGLIVAGVVLATLVILLKSRT